MIRMIFLLGLTISSVSTDAVGQQRQTRSQTAAATGDAWARGQTELRQALARLTAEIPNQTDPCHARHWGDFEMSQILNLGWHVSANVMSLTLLESSQSRMKSVEASRLAIAHGCLDTARRIRVRILDQFDVNVLPLFRDVLQDLGDEIRHAEQLNAIRQLRPERSP